LQPADTEARLANIGTMINSLKSDQSSAASDKDRIGRICSGLNSLEAPKKYGMSVVAASELEMVRKKVNPMLRAQNTNAVAPSDHLDIAR